MVKCEPCGVGEASNSEKNSCGTLSIRSEVVRSDYLTSVPRHVSKGTQKFRTKTRKSAPRFIFQVGLYLRPSPYTQEIVIILTQCVWVLCSFYCSLENWFYRSALSKREVQRQFNVEMCCLLTWYYQFPGS